MEKNNANKEVLDQDFVEFLLLVMRAILKYLSGFIEL